MSEAELATVTAGLPERFADRLQGPDLDGLRSMARGGEWDELLDLLVAALRAARAPVTREERDQLRDALTGLGDVPRRARRAEGHWLGRRFRGSAGGAAPAPRASRHVRLHRIRA
jgi:hypothetical protein